MAEIEKLAGNLGNVPGMVDTKREAEGAWYDHDAIDGFKEALVNSDGYGLLAVKVCSRFTSAYRKKEQEVHSQALNKASKERLGYITDEVARLNAANCVVDWDFTDNDGQEIPFSVESVSTLYTKEGEKGIQLYRFHRAFIEAAIAALHVDVEKQQEEDSGKSESA
jgi:hypothetical protein